MSVSRAPGLVWAGFLLFWLVGTIVWSLAAITGGAPPPDALRVGAFQMGVATVLAVGIWRLSASLPWQLRSPAFALVHLAALAVFAGLYMTSQVVLFTPDHPVPEALRRVWTSPVAGWNLLIGSFLYLAIAGVSYARRAEGALRESERARADARLAARDAQLAALNAQLQPHFLFNALNTVSALVHTDPERADRALDALGQLLRYALREPGDDVTLRQEWDFARDYLAFATLRLGDRLRLDVSADEAALGVRVPPFVLQPLIENAVHHGVAGSPEGGTVAIRLVRQSGTVRITIRNTVPRGGNEAAGMAGSGLARLRERLALRYGADRARVEAVAEKGSFEVTVIMPVGAEDP